VRALGRATQEALDRLRSGISVAGVRYGPIEATLDREQGANVWLTMGLREGKNREVRKVLEQLGLTVNRLIRVAYGPFELGELDDGAVEEVETVELRKALGPEIAEQANADFDSPLEDETARRPETRGERQQGRGDKRRDEKHFTRPLRGRPTLKRRDKKHRRDRSGGPRPSRPRA
jgi:23S rRNA pseudouridine2605 synthase